MHMCIHAYKNRSCICVYLFVCWNRLGAEMSKLAEELNYEREIIRIWFCNKRQVLKNTVRQLSRPEEVHKLTCQTNLLVE